MENFNQKQPLPQLGIQPKEPKHGSKKMIWIFIVLLVIAAAVWYFFFHDKRKIPETPEDVLRGLSEISLPVTATSAERTNEVKLLEKNSVPVQKTPEERLRELEVLEEAE